jgi:hypothetical protein
MDPSNAMLLRLLMTHLMCLEWVQRRWQNGSNGAPEMRLESLMLAEDQAEEQTWTMSSEEC